MNSYSLLIVEDERELLSRYKRHAQKVFSRVFTAETCQSALSILSSHRIDSIVADNKLPDGESISTIKKILTTKKHMPIVIMTAFPDKDILVKAINAHIFYFLEKPFTNEKLFSVLDKLTLLLNKQEKNNTIIDLCRLSEKTEQQLKKTYAISDRELEVISYALFITHNSTIGKRLCISTETVKKHLSHVFLKLRISSKHELQETIFAMNQKNNQLVFTK